MHSNWPPLWGADGLVVDLLRRLPIGRWALSGGAGLCVTLLSLYSRGWGDLLHCEWWPWESHPVVWIAWPADPEPLWVVGSVLSVVLGIWSTRVVDDLLGPLLPGTR